MIADPDGRGKLKLTVRELGPGNDLEGGSEAKQSSGRDLGGEMPAPQFLSWLSNPTMQTS